MSAVYPTCCRTTHPTNRKRRSQLPPSERLYSARGTRLNKRGSDSRKRFLDAAIAVLAEGGADAATPNQIARRCGYTWGRVSHHFGDTDGTWAAILDEVLERRQHFQTLQLPAAASLRDSMDYLIERMWGSYDLPEIRAVQQVRRNVLKDRGRLSVVYPKTAAALLRWDADWETVWETVFSGLGVSSERITHVRSLVPGALRGLHAQRELGTYTNVDVGRRCLKDALVLYLQS